MQHWTDSWLVLVIVMVLAWQVFPPGLLEKLMADRSSPVEKYLKETGAVCDYEPSPRIEYETDHTFVLKNARVIDGNGSFAGIRDLHVKKGKIDRLKKAPWSRDVVLWNDHTGADGGLYGKYVTPGLIDPFGVEQDGVTTKIVHKDGYGSAYKNDRLVMEQNWVRLDDRLHRAKRLWVTQELWCEKLKNDIKSLNGPIPEEEGLQPLVDYFRGLKPINESIGGKDLLFQAQLNYHYGKSVEEALGEITGEMAQNLGIDRVGFLRPGYDADFVVWDRHPLQLGAKPEEVYIDGEPQLQLPHHQTRSQVAADEYTPPKLDQRNLTHLDIADFVITGIVESHVAYPAGRVVRPQDRFQLVVQNRRVVCFSTDCRRYFGSLFRLDMTSGYIMPQLAELANKTVVSGSREFLTLAPVIETHDVKVIKKLIENKRLYNSEFVVLGGRDAHLLAHDLAVEEIPVILTEFESRVGYQSNLNTLFSAGVKLGLSDTPLRFKAGLAAELSGLQRNDVLDMVSTNMFQILDIEKPSGMSFVVSEGFGLNIGSKIAAVVEDGMLKMALV